VSQSGCTVAPPSSSRPAAVFASPLLLRARRAITALPPPRPPAPDHLYARPRCPPCGVRPEPPRCSTSTHARLRALAPRAPNVAGAAPTGKETIASHLRRRTPGRGPLGAASPELPRHHSRLRRPLQRCLVPGSTPVPAPRH
jgi:hypothetical protein